MIKNIFLLTFFCIFLNGCLETIHLPKNLFTKKIAQPKTCEQIKIVSNPYYPPFSVIDENNEYVGFGIELTKAILNNLNVKYTFIKTNSLDESINLISENNADLIIGIYNDQKTEYLYIEPNITNDEPMELFKKGILNRWEILQTHNGKDLYFAFASKTPCQTFADKISQEIIKLKENSKIDEAILKSIKVDNIQSIKPRQKQENDKKQLENEKNAVVEPINILNF